MKGDFSRDTFDINKHFSRVLMQQGRVQLDADWNEQTAILLHYMRTLAADLIGPFAGPDPAIGSGNNGECGFEIKKRDETDTNLNETNFKISKGRYYVDGILCENQEQTTYQDQEDYPVPDDLLLNKNYLVYLDVWERHITPIEDDDIREKALDGPDTATRAKVVWQVKATEKIHNSNGDPIDINGNFKRADVLDAEWWKNFVCFLEKRKPEEHGCLRARVQPQDMITSPCTTAPASKYRGENQLYRIEIHQDNLGDNSGKAPTFKWSRDNGAITSRVEKVNGTEIVVLNPRGFAAEQWVELTNDTQELHGKHGILVKLTKVEGDKLTFEEQKSGETSNDGMNIGDATKVHRWDQKENDNVTLIEGTVEIVEINGEGQWIDLEYGLQVHFKPGGKYRTGDYWLIPARAATGDIEWPPQIDENGKVKLDIQKNPIPDALPPHGIHHHYAPLAILISNGPTWEDPSDLRCKFQPLAFAQCGNLYSYGEEGIGGHLLCSPNMVVE